MVRITLIEDDPAINEALSLILEISGFSVTTFLDDRDFNIEDAPMADLYIIDRQLRGVDGLELCRQLKSLPATSQTPVIIISASPYIQPLAAAAGADHFLEKPFSKKQLLGSIELVLAAT